MEPYLSGEAEARAETSGYYLPLDKIAHAFTAPPNEVHKIIRDYVDLLDADEKRGAILEHVRTAQKQRPHHSTIPYRRVPFVHVEVIQALLRSGVLVDRLSAMAETAANIPTRSEPDALAQGMAVDWATTHPRSYLRWQERLAKDRHNREYVSGTPMHSDAVEPASRLLQHRAKRLR